MSGFSNKGRIIRNSSEDPLLTNFDQGIPIMQSELWAADAGTAWKKLKSDLQALRVSLYGKSSAVGDTPMLLDAAGYPLVKIGGDSGGAFVQAKVGASADGISGTNNNALYTNAIKYLFDGANLQLERQAPSGTTGAAATGVAAAVQLAMDHGSTYQPLRGNIEGTLLSSAVRSATTSSSTQYSFNARGILLILQITSYVADNISLAVKAINPANGAEPALLQGAALTATGWYAYLIYPGIGPASAGVTGVESRVLPYRWYVTISHSAGSDFTYSLGACWMN